LPEEHTFIGNLHQNPGLGLGAFPRSEFYPSAL
jgi:hypothetical protein